MVGRMGKRVGGKKEKKLRRGKEKEKKSKYAVKNRNTTEMKFEKKTPTGSTGNCKHGQKKGAGR